MPSTTLTSSGTWPAPSNMVPGSLQVYVTGDGNTGGTSQHGSHGGGGGGGGAFAGEPDLGGVTPGVTTLTITFGSTTVSVTGGSVAVTANNGSAASGQTAGSGGAAGSNTIAFAGGSGGTGTSGSSEGGSGGGGSAGSTGAGGTGAAGTSGGGGSGGTAGTGAAGPPSLAGATGAAGGSNTGAGNNGIAPGSGGSGGGCGSAGNQTGGTGATGQVVIIWAVITISPSGYMGIAGTASTSKKATTAVKGYLSLTGGTPRVIAVNAWSGTFAQPSSFQTTPPALLSTVVALTPAASVGGGTGVPSQGNWLICLSGWNQSGLPAVTAGVCDDIHSFWRAGNPWTSDWAVSPASGNTRANVWYTANLQRQPGDVYAAPSGAMAGMACLVVEVQGLGPWDVVTGIDVAYAAAATTLSLSLPAPSAASFIIGAVCGDSTAASQAFSPSGWHPLPSVTADNGSDHTCDAVLTSAYLPTTSSSVSVSATAGSDTDLSGVLLAVQVSAPSPIPSGANPAWPGRFVVEAAFGAGYETPQDQRQWTVLTDNAWTSGQGIKRAWGLTDDTGIPYMLGQLQTGTGTWEMDDQDGALSPARVSASGPWSYAATGTPSSGTYFTVTTAQAASISTGQGFTDASNPGTLFTVSSVGAPVGGLVNVSFYPAAGNVMASGDVVTQVNPVAGTPVRVRAALGTIATPQGSATYDRWHVIERDAQDWAELRNEAQRNYIQMATTDIWGAACLPACPTPYRGELEQDLSAAASAWWWPMDDQPGVGGVLPSSLRNAAKGSSTVLDILLSPNGGQWQEQCILTGGAVETASQPGLIANYDVAQDQDWMPGDPQSAPQSVQSGNPVTAQPGSAAWQQTGVAGTTGSYAWFLRAQDTFPPLASGATVETWFNFAYYGTSAVATSTTTAPVAGQPLCPLTIAALYGSSGPAAILQLDTSGHLSLTTYSGGSGTSHSIYTASDLRNAMFNQVIVTLTTTTWSVYVNGGLTASASGTCPAITSAWGDLFIGADVGSNAPSDTSAVQHAGNVSLSHASVHSGVLPPWRARARYCAAITGFGLLPAPTGVSAQFIASGTSATPDGSVVGLEGTYGGTTGSSTAALTVIAAAVAGNYSSGPSAWAPATAVGTKMPAWVTCTALAPLVRFYTASQLGSETEASAVCGTGDAYTGGYGSGASGSGFSHVSGGTGAAPPSAPSGMGDSVAWRVERLLWYAGITLPLRAVDASATEPVQAAGDIGGQACGANLQHMVDSDDGLMFPDLGNALSYRSRPHLAQDIANGPAWYIGMNVAAGDRPFGKGITYPNDVQKVCTAITIAPYRPDGSSAAIITPQDAAAVDASQVQVGARPLQVSSYLQSAVSQQDQADWLYQTFGQNQRRAEKVTIDAASHPAAWALWFGCNISDIVQLYDAPIGAPATTGLYRVTYASRALAYGANNLGTKATLTLTLEPLPADYWT